MTENRNKRLIVRLSGEEHKLLSLKATAAGMTLSALVRDHINQVRIYNHADRERRLRAVSAMENSIAALAKASSVLTPLDSVSALAYLAAIHRYLERLTKENQNCVSEIFPSRGGHQ